MPAAHTTTITTATTTTPPLSPTHTPRTPPRAPHTTTPHAVRPTPPQSRFWYFMHQYRNMKKTTGEILDVNEIREKDPNSVKNYALWLRYDSRSGTHNMYREYRALSLNNAVDQVSDARRPAHARLYMIPTYV